MVYTLDDPPTFFPEKGPKIFVTTYKRPDKFVARDYAQDSSFCFVVQNTDPLKEEYFTKCKNVLLVECGGLYAENQKRNIILKYSRHHNLTRYADINDDVVNIRDCTGVTYSLKEGFSTLFQEFEKTNYPLIGIPLPGFCFGKTKPSSTYRNGWVSNFFYFNHSTFPRDLVFFEDAILDIGMCLSLLYRGIPYKLIQDWSITVNQAVGNSCLDSIIGQKYRICFNSYKKFGEIIYWIRKKHWKSYPNPVITIPYRVILNQGGFKVIHDYQLMKAIMECEKTDYTDFDKINAVLDLFHFKLMQRKGSRQ